MSLRETAREHVVLEHVVETDAHLAREEDGHQPKEERNQKNAKGEGFVKTPIQEDAKAGQEGDITLGQVIKAWKQVGAVIRDNPNLKALLNSCRVLELRDKTLTLGFTSEILRTKVNTPENVETICKAIKESLGVDLGVKCIVSNAKQSTPPDIKADGMVAAALKAGGEIVDMHD